jgi:F0F1-type ATP synthase membrane subunit b/b'
VDPVMLANAGPMQTFVVQLLGFIALVLILVKLAFPALGKMLGARTKGIEETFQEIDRDTQDTAKRMAEIKERLTHLDQESKRRLQAAMDDAQKTRTQLLADASAQVQAAAEKSMREIGIERDKAVLELRQEATNLTLQAADHVVQSAMNDALQEKLVAKYLSELDGVRKT